MNKVGIFNCPVVKKNDYVEFVYGCDSIENPLYKCRAIGKVIYVDGDVRILLELPQNFKQTGAIKGWKCDDIDILKKIYGCCENKLYWWVSTYRILNKSLKIE